MFENLQFLQKTKNELSLGRLTAQMAHQSFFMDWLFFGEHTFSVCSAFLFYAIIDGVQVLTFIYSGRTFSPHSVSSLIDLCERPHMCEAKGNSVRFQNNFVMFFVGFTSYE
jgi:hypothetical protein